MFFNGAISSGHFSSPVDLSPNYAGTMFGISNTLSGGFIGYTTPVIVGIITQDNMTWTAWTSIFGGAAAIYIITNFFCFFIAMNNSRVSNTMTIFFHKSLYVRNC